MGNALQREDPHAYSSRDKGRGIANVTVAKNTNPERFTAPTHAYGMEGYGEDEAQNDPRYDTAKKFSIGEQFIEKESIDAKVFNRSRAKEGTQNNQSYVGGEAQQQLNMGRIQRTESARQRKMYVRSRTAGRVVRKLATSRWMGLGVAATAYFWQFVCGVISIVALSAQSGISSFLSSSTLGKSMKWVTSFFVDIESIFPIGALGWVFWGISTMIAISIFIIFFLYFYISGIRVFHSTLSTLITIGCLTFSLIPVLNLGPWLVLWIFYIYTRSLFSSS